jgi:hypothetical protein
MVHIGLWLTMRPYKHDFYEQCTEVNNWMGGHLSGKADFSSTWKVPH